jgi:hypothetical protein
MEKGTAPTSAQLDAMARALIELIHELHSQCAFDAIALPELIARRAQEIHPHDAGAQETRQAMLAFSDLLAHSLRSRWQ